MDTNYEVALKAEMKKVVRMYQPYTSEQRANHAASHRLGHKQRKADGHFFYMHPAIKNRAFDTRTQAAKAGLEASE